MTLACPTAQTFWATSVWSQEPQAQPQAGDPAHLDAADLALDFAVVGLNHQTAPLEVREQVAVRPDQVEAVLARLSEFAREVMLLSTCNRTEIYLAGVQGNPRRAFEECFASHTSPGHTAQGQGQSHPLGQHLYVYQHDQAAEHLYRVTAGLDSLVIGETQIQGQVKRAWQDAHSRHLCGTLMNKVAQGALAAGKRVRSETGMSDKVVSVSSAAVELAQSVLGELAGRRALILGAGETAELTMTHLRAAGVEDVVVVNRTEARAQQLAAKLGGCAYAYDQLTAVLPSVDIVIASSAAPHYVLSGPQVRYALTQQMTQRQATSPRPMFLIDISMPRILHPNISEVDGAYLYNLDDLTRIVQTNLSSRREAIPHAEAIVRELVSDLNRWNLTRNAQIRLKRRTHLQDVQPQEHLLEEAGQQMAEQAR